MTESLLHWQRTSADARAARCTAEVDTRAGNRRCGNRAAHPSGLCWRHRGK